MIDCAYIQSVSKLAPLINNELLYPYYCDNYSDESLSIVHRSSMYNKLALFVMLKTLLRFSDLQKFDLPTAVKNKIYHIRQSKTDRNMTLDFIIVNDNLRQQLLSIKDFSQYLNYENLRNEIRWITPHTIQHVLLGHNRSTHIFRHLETSFLTRKGLTSKQIARRLGHADISTQKIYTHEFPLL